MSFISSFAAALGRTAQKARDFLSRDVMLSPNGFGLAPAELRDIVNTSEYEAKRQKEVLRARAFHEGDHGVQLTERLKEFLGDDAEDAPRLNFTQVVALAVAERLKITDFECPDKAYLVWALKVWEDSRMPTKQPDLWEESLVDAEHFLLVHWNAAGNKGKGEVELIPHPRYTDATVLFGATGGDGFGMLMVYPNNDTSRRPLYAVKRSTETNEEGQKQQQITVYRPHEFARYYFKQGEGWMPLREVDQATGDFKPWPTPWVNPTTGEPLGIPVVQTKNPRLRSEAREAHSLQKGLNKLYLDFMTANDETAFRIWVYAGWDPGAVTTSPGSWVGSPDSKKDDGFIAQAVDGVDTGPMLAGIEKTIVFIAQVTSTPTQRLQMSGQIARAETLESQDEPLRIKCENRQDSFGQAITDAFRIGARIQNAFGGGTLNENSRAKPVWKPFSNPIVATQEEGAPAPNGQAKTPPIKKASKK